MSNVVPMHKNKRDEIGSEGVVELNNDNAAIALIKGLDLLTLFACNMGMVGAAESIAFARDDVADWASDQDFSSTHFGGEEGDQSGVYVLMLLEMFIRCLSLEILTQ